MRGKRAEGRNRQGKNRITPAGAGKTATSIRVTAFSGDHPRRCGENRRYSQAILRTIGSPPQVRGKPGNVPITAGGSRITPAGAGKTFGRTSGGKNAQDHPRRCGENPCNQSVKAANSGSPPQVRGKLTYPERDREVTRITPAGAGKTRTAYSKIQYHKDHPRRCGENTGLSPVEAGWAGSPPQVRGKHIIRRFQIPVSGITPAGAGKTLLLRCRRMCCRDHPRRCGENWSRMR